MEKSMLAAPKTSRLSLSAETRMLLASERLLEILLGLPFHSGPTLQVLQPRFLALGIQLQASSTAPMVMLSTQMPLEKSLSRPSMDGSPSAPDHALALITGIRFDWAQSNRCIIDRIDAHKELAYLKPYRLNHSESPLAEYTRASQPKAPYCHLSTRFSPINILGE